MLTQRYCRPPRQFLLIALQSGTVPPRKKWTTRRREQNGRYALEIRPLQRGARGRPSTKDPRIKTKGCAFKRLFFLWFAFYVSHLNPWALNRTLAHGSTIHPPDESTALPTAALMAIASMHVIDQGIRDIASEFRFTVEEVQEFYDKCGEMGVTRSRFQRMREELQARFKDDMK